MSGAPRVAVVGAGLAGLACAARLAHAGHDVDLFEQQSFAGGKVGSEVLGGYRFDTGPSFVTLPQVFAELFWDLGRRMEDYCHFVPLSTICGYYLSDGTRLRAFADSGAFAEEMRAATGEPPESLDRYLRHGGEIWRRAADHFLGQSLHDPGGPAWFAHLPRLPDLARIDPFRSLDAANRSFFRDPRIVQLFNRYATYTGSSPYRAPGTLAVIPYLEHAFGGFAVEGGVFAIPSAMAKVCEEEGVRIHLDTRVDRILHKDRKVDGIEVAGERVPVDVVVCNADVTSMYRDLLDDDQARMAKRYARLEPSSSSLVFYWGVAGSFPELGFNNVFFSDDYPGEFDDIFARRRCPVRPTVYVNITSKVDRRDALPGTENWFVLVNAPSVAGQDWASEVKRTRAAVLSLLETRLGRPVEALIEVEAVGTPVDIESTTGSHRGNLYGISSNSRLAAFLRHPNRAREYRRLYVCGGTSHPGGGMPFALLSGKITADLVCRFEGRP